MAMVTKSGRSRWPLTIGAALLIVAIGGGITYSVTRPAPEPLAGPSVASSMPTSSPTATSPGRVVELGDDVAPTGCLGGLDRNADMVLAAQASAKHTTYGAVETATAIYRWLWRYPTPPSSESDIIGAEIISSAATPTWKNVTAQYESAFWTEQVSEYEARDGEFHTSSTNGLWRVAEGSTIDEVDVELSLGTVVDGALSPTKSTASGFTMVWEDERWHLQSGFVVDETKLTTAGTRFTGGC